MDTVKDRLVALLEMLSGDLNYDNIHKVKDRLKDWIETATDLECAAKEAKWFGSVQSPDGWNICAPGSPQDLANKRYDKIESATEVQDLRTTGGCLMARRDRGDCEHYVGMPEIEDEKTTDAYGRPHGWCEVCWRGEQIRRLKIDMIQICEEHNIVPELKDKTRYHHILMQLHDGGVISTKSLVQELGLDYEKEVERMRKAKGD